MHWTFKKKSYEHDFFFQAIETFPRIFNDSYWLPALIHLIRLCNTCYKIVLRCLFYQQMLIFIQSARFPCFYAVIFVWKRKSSYCLDNLICLEMLSYGTFSDKKTLEHTSLFVFDLLYIIHCLYQRSKMLVMVHIWWSGLHCLYSNYKFQQ